MGALNLRTFRGATLEFLSRKWERLEHRVPNEYSQDAFPMRYSIEYFMGQVNKITIETGDIEWLYDRERNSGLGRGIFTVKHSPIEKFILKSDSKKTYNAFLSIASHPVLEVLSKNIDLNTTGLHLKRVTSISTVLRQTVPKIYYDILRDTDLKYNKSFLEGETFRDLFLQKKIFTYNSIFASKEPITDNKNILLKTGRFFTEDTIKPNMVEPRLAETQEGVDYLSTLQNVLKNEYGQTHPEIWLPRNIDRVLPNLGPMFLSNKVYGWRYPTIRRFNSNRFTLNNSPLFHTPRVMLVPLILKFKLHNSANTDYVEAIQPAISLNRYILEHNYFLSE